MSFYLISIFFMVVIGHVFWTFIPWARNAWFVLLGLPIGFSAGLMASILVWKRLEKNNWCKNNKYVTNFLKFLYKLVLWIATCYAVSVFAGYQVALVVSSFVFVFIHLYYEFGEASHLLKVEKSGSFTADFDEKFWRVVLFLGFVLFVASFAIIIPDILGWQI